MARPPAATWVGTPDEVEAQFYEAMRRADIERLMSLWADDDEIVCIHPGGGRISGAGAIRASFEAIFANGGVPVRPEQVRRIAHHGCALHHLVERIEVVGADGPVVAWACATNVYLKTPVGWRIASHHASAGGADDPSAAGAEPSSTLH